MNPPSHPLFKHYPLTSNVAISTGEVPVPYHIYNGYGFFIGGVGDLAATKRLLQDEAVHPLQTADGRAVLGLWICNFTEASLGPHHELQVSCFVSDQATPPIAPHPLNAPALILTRPDIQLLCHGLWNNTPTVVAYNRELLSLSAQLTASRIERTSDKVTFQFKAETANRLILAGEIRNPQRAASAVNLSLMRRIGLRRMFALAREPWVSMKMRNPVGVVLNRNAVAELFTKNDANVMRLFDRQTGMLEFGDTPYRSLQFIPQCVQYMDGIKFVYLLPT